IPPALFNHAPIENSVRHVLPSSAISLQDTKTPSRNHTLTKTTGTQPAGVPSRHLVPRGE
ncbi:hypothetical protein RSAG8_08891, partial [Rhizoctonia solani AG-8 WAC10335]